MNLIFPIILLCLVAAPICRGKIVSDERRWNDDDDENNHDADEGSSEDRDADDRSNEDRDTDDRSNEERGNSNDGELNGLARYGPAPLGHNGQVIDTGDVEHAKGLHFEAYAKMASLAAQHGSGKGHRRNQWRANDEHADNSDAGSLKWSGPFAEVELTSDGFLKYTPEVAHERAKHLSAHAAATALAEQNGSSGLDNGYSDEQDGGQGVGQERKQDGGREREQDGGQDDSIEQDGGDSSDEQDEY